MLKLGKVVITPKEILLLLIRESYLFFRNLLGLIYHPYKTLRHIRREEDISQALLLAGFPTSAIFISFFIFVIAKFIFHLFGPLANILYICLLAYWLIGLLVFLYLLYWTIFYLRVERKLKK